MPQAMRREKLKPCPSCRGAVAEPDLFCRHCGEALTSQRRRWSGRDWKHAALALAQLAWLTVVLTTFLTVFYSMEVIAAAGLILLLLALAMAWPGVKLRSRRVTGLAVGHIVVCLVTYLLVVFLGFRLATVVGIVWTTASLVWTLSIFRLKPPSRNPWECVKCGYLLVGLDSDRCPECGTPFLPPDPRKSPSGDIKPAAGPALP